MKRRLETNDTRPAKRILFNRWSTMYVDMLREIFMRVPDPAACMLVCRHWCAAAKDPRVWPECPPGWDPWTYAAQICIRSALPVNNNVFGCWLQRKGDDTIRKQAVALQFDCPLSDVEITRNWLIRILPMGNAQRDTYVVALARDHGLGWVYAPGFSGAQFCKLMHLRRSHLSWEDKEPQFFIDYYCGFFPKHIVVPR